MSRAFLPHCSMIVLLLHWQNSAALTQNKPHKNNEEWTCSCDRMLKFLCWKTENENTQWHVNSQWNLVRGWTWWSWRCFPSLVIHNSVVWQIYTVLLTPLLGVVGQGQRRPLSCIPTNPGKDSFAQKKALIVNPGIVSLDHFEELEPKIVLTFFFFPYI